MKKLIVMVLVAMAALVMCACGGNASSETGKEDASSKTETEKKEEAKPEHTDDEFTIEEISYTMMDENDESLGIYLNMKVRNNSGEDVDYLELDCRALDSNGDVLGNIEPLAVEKLSNGQAAETSDFIINESYKDIQTIEVLSYEVCKRNDDDILEVVYDHDYEKPVTFKMADIPKK